MDSTNNKQTILIVDDMPMNLKVLATELEKDYIVKLATKGKEALAIVESKLPDIILLDVMMPEINGYELCKILKKNPSTASIPVIFITAKSDEADEEYGLSIGGADYIIKPFSIPIVKSRIKKELTIQNQLVELKHSRDEYALLTDSTHIHIWHLKDTHTCGSVNQTHANFFGYEKKDFENKSLFEVLPKEVADRCVKANIEVFENKKSLSTEEWVANSAGENRLLAVFKTPKLDQMGNVEYVICTGEDITEKRQAEKELLWKNAHFEALFTSTNSAIIYFDTEGMIRSVNQKFTEMFGYQLDEVKDKCISDIMDPTKKMVDCVSLKILQDQIIEEEMEVCDKDGDILQVILKGAPVYVDGIIVGGYTNLGDISSRKSIEHQLNNYVLELELKGMELEEIYKKLDQEVNKAKDIHENNLPLNLPEIENMSISAYYNPAYVMGGDYYDVIKVQDKLVFYISDVSGHSLDGALLSVFIKNTINSYLSLVECKEINPTSILQHVFKQYNKDNYPNEYFICLFVGVVDIKTNQLSYLGSGFHFPGLVVIDGRTIELFAGGLPIASVYDMDLLEQKEELLNLTENSTILIYTDGIIEEVIKGDQYGIPRLKNVLSQNAAMPTAVIRDKISDDFYNFTGSESSQDDITYLILQIVKNRKSLSYEINSTIEEPTKMVEIIEKQLDDQIQDKGLILMGLYEFLVNAVEHGNKFDSNKTVKVELEMTDSYIYVTVEDMGAGFEWQKLLKKEYDIESLDERGRGLVMAKMCFDYISYNSVGNQVKLVKHI